MIRTLTTFLLLFFIAPPASADDVNLSDIEVPPGFKVEIFASGLSGPRMMKTRKSSEVCVAERAASRIVCYTDPNFDGKPNRKWVAADGLDTISSLEFAPNGDMYVGLTPRILLLSNPDKEGKYQARRTLIDGLPVGGHVTRTVLLTPDSRTLLVSIGSSCNVCTERDPRRAAVVRYDPDGKNERLFAKGLRNAVGITFRPGTSELWATNNGRDMLGDDLPPENIFQVSEGKDYGWPRCHSGSIVDPEFGKLLGCAGVEKPKVEMQAHSAPLGLIFYKGTQFPKDYDGSLFVAFHGSWNRSSPTGYKVIRIPFVKGDPGKPVDFAKGWLKNGKVSGRPVDVTVAQDGSLFISDDFGGKIYRVTYSGRR